MKGQGIVFDFVVSLSFFVVAVVILAGGMDALSERLEADREYASMARAAYFASEALVSSTGSMNGQPNWNTYTFSLSGTQLGLAAAPGELNRAKIEGFAALNASDYDNLRSSLGIGTYDFYVNVTRVVAGTGYYVGKGFDNTTGEIEYRMERLAILDGNLTRVTVGVWK